MLCELNIWMDNIKEGTQSHQFRESCVAAGPGVWERKMIITSEGPRRRPGKYVMT